MTVDLAVSGPLGPSREVLWVLMASRQNRSRRVSCTEFLYLIKGAPLTRAAARRRSATAARSCLPPRWRRPPTTRRAEPGSVESGPPHGSGERTFSGIAASTGGADGRPLAHGTLAPILTELTEAKKIVAAELPLSTQPAPKLKRYRIADTYLRFWLAHLENAVAQAERGRGEVSAARIQQSWPSWRGRAVEPVIREALARRVPDEVVAAWR